MAEMSKRATVYFESDLHKAVLLKAESLHRSISDIVNDAVRLSLHEDQEDLAAFDERCKEPNLSCEALFRNLKKNGKL